MSVYRDRKLTKIVEILKREFNPSRVFLFGSRASKTHHQNSDYDLVLVVPGLKNRFAAEVRARSLILNKCGVSADVFLYSPQAFDEWKDELSSIPETAINTGLEIELG